MVLEVCLKNSSKIIQLVGSNLYHIILESLEMKILNVVSLKDPYLGLFFSLYI